MDKGKWIKAEDNNCPRCNNPLEELHVSDEDEFGEEQVCINKERCPVCRWIVDFEADPIEAKRY